MHACIITGISVFLFGHEHKDLLLCVRNFAECFVQLQRFLVIVETVDDIGIVDILLVDDLADIIVDQQLQVVQVEVHRVAVDLLAERPQAVKLAVDGFGREGDLIHGYDQALLTFSDAADIPDAGAVDPGQP